MIRTVTGDIQPEELGNTLCHEHFIVDLDRVRHDGQSRIDTPQEAEPEIRKAMAYGIRSAIEMTTIDMGRDLAKLKEISEDTGLHIIAATGFYLSEYHPAWLKDADPEEIADLFIRELTRGEEKTGIRPGIIGEIASSKDSFMGEEKKVLRAAGIASKATGAAVSTHTGRNTAQETIEILLSEGVDPDRIIIGHQDLIDDTEYHLSLLSQGVNIAFDTCGKSAYMPDEARAKNALAIVKAGYRDHLLLSNDVSRRTYFTSYGKWGYTAANASVVPLMKKIGITEEDLEAFFHANPARILDNPQWGGHEE